MSDNSKIEWTDASWNPVRGCTKVSAGCKHCYAETFAERWRGVPGHAFEQGFDLKLVPEALSKPLRWREPRRIFVNSMSDLFHEGVPDEYIASVFGVMAAAPRHTFQVLTKRPERMRAWFSDPDRASDVAAAAEHAMRQHGVKGFVWDARGSDVWKYGGKTKAADVANRRPWVGWPLPNVWLGVSVEDHNATKRIDALRDCPAAVRFISAEPLLQGWHLRPHLSPEHGGGGIDWLILGGESGPGARPLQVDWLRDMVSEARGRCKVFVKQLGAYVVDRNDAGWSGDDVTDWPDGTEYVDDEEHAQGWQGERVRVRLKSRKGNDPTEWPESLRVREFPSEVSP